MTTSTLETIIHKLARDLPIAYVNLVAAACGEPFDPEDEIPDIEVSVEFTPGWFTPGRLSGPPENCYPDEGESPEIIKVTILEGDHDITADCTPEEIQRLEDEAWESQQESDDDYYPDDRDDYQDDDYQEQDYDCYGPC